jgi:hypothetical protein
MKEFNVPYDQLKVVREEEPLKWEFWKSYLTEEGRYQEIMMKKNKKTWRRRR